MRFSFHLSGFLDTGFAAAPVPGGGRVIHVVRQNMNPKINLISIFVSDISRMVSFYRDVIGFQVKRYSPGSPYASFDTGTIRLALYERVRLNELFSVPVQFPTDINGSFAIAVLYASPQELEKEAERIIQAGARPMHQIRDEPWKVRSLTVADPEGNLVELYADI